MSDSLVTEAAAGAPDGALRENRVLLILAADHRDSLERGLYRLTAPPTSAQAARISAGKLLVYQALLDAAGSLPAQTQPGVLIDEQYGASVAELASHSAGAVSLCMPVEASGQQWFRFAYGDEWQRHAGFFAAEHAKVLVRDNPGLDPARREQQARRLSEVSAWASRTGRSLLLELLVPATDADKDGTEGSTDRYDNELRPGGLVRFSVPPSASARSRRPVSPEPSGSAPPTPSSRTDRLSTSRPASTDTVTVSACACLAMLASASETM
jgi:hypothetical protein